MRPTPVRIAVVGAGLIGRAHLARIEASPNATLAGIADPAADAAGLAALAGAPHAPDLASLLRAAPVDGVVVATPNRQHVTDVMTALEAGLPCLVEKPLAEDAPGAERLVEVAAQRRIALQVGHHRRHSGALRGAREIVASGRLGRITAANALCLFRKPDDYFEGAGSWRRRAGGGLVLINLVHVVDDLRTLLGEVEEVQAVTTNRARGFDVEDTVGALLRFRSGALATLAASDAAAAPWSWEMTAGENAAYPRTDEACYVVAGTDASLSVPRLELWSHGEARSWFSPLLRERRVAPATDPLTSQMDHFIRVVRGEAAPYPDGTEGLATLRATLAIARSAASGRPVNP
ncbi:Gfo/Idh/MocA family protein [Roseomonas sp. CCTCC AB2023176]|uniref:Gfo/Idh/MocA family protein n=1 Tax=Roseomonas sp. CCTCC AB2023176 TaxID=3342640 RepID=UPI0035E0E60F